MNFEFVGNVAKYFFHDNSQLAEHCTGIAEVMGLNPVQA